ncbi:MULTISPECIES: hypothetical protein [unclassified Rickettsia]|uniref:hypothetical protein n=1 Tax=unclassified Rickettsia TaxID=114295 RepID=UPI003133062A
MFSFFKNSKIKQLSTGYKEETLKYTKNVNEFRNEGMKTLWQEPVKTEAPIDTREKYVEEVYKIILEFNKNNKVKQLRELFPPQTEIFYSFTENKDTVGNIHKIVAISDDIFLVAVDEPRLLSEDNRIYYQRNCYVYKNKKFHELKNVLDFGVCPQKKIISYIKEDGIYLTNYHNDKEITYKPWAKEKVYFPDGSIAVNDCDLSNIFGDLYVPFSDGKKILMGGYSFGLILLELETNRRTLIFPDKQYYDEYIKDNPKKKGKPLKNILELWEFPMFHFSLSHNNQYIALGFQSSFHNLYDINGNLIGSALPISSYPHYAIFSQDDKQIAFNSCHFYNGGTIAVQLQEIQNNGNLEKQEDYEDYIELDTESRVYAAVSTSYGYIIGDAQGYIRARSYNGDHLWDDYLGFNIQTMDITSDEKFLYVGTYKGIVYKIRLNSGTIDPYKIGNSTNYEEKRWMFWEENNILEW